MTNPKSTLGNEPAFPTEFLEHIQGRLPKSGPLWGGLTKREYFAAMAMQGVESANFASEYQDGFPSGYVAARAVELADALIKALGEAK